MFVDCWYQMSWEHYVTHTLVMLFLCYAIRLYKIFKRSTVFINADKRTI